MKRLKDSVGQTIIAIGMLGAGNAYGIGLGGYAMSASGSADFEETDLNITASVDTRQSGVAFVLDTNVAKDRLFNYRLGIELNTIDYEDFELDEMRVVNDFGFGVLRSDMVRVWLGPEILVSGQSGTDRFGNDWTGGGIGIGGVLGVNVHLSDSISLFAKGGSLHSVYTLDADTFIGTFTYDVTHSSTFVNAGILVRFNE